MASHRPTYLLLLIFVSIEYAMTAPSRETEETADKCPPLSDLANGTYTVRNQTVKYKCKSGFVMVGDENVHCNGTHWSSNPPQCLRRRQRQQQHQHQQQQQQSKTTKKTGRKRSSTVHSITVQLINTRSTTLSPTRSTTPRVKKPKKMSALSLTATPKLPTATTTARATNQTTSTTLSPTSSTTPRVKKTKKMSTLSLTATSKFPTATTTARATNQTTSTTLSPTSLRMPRVKKPKKVSALSLTATSKLPTATTTARATTETTSTTLSPTTTLRIETTSSTVLPTTTMTTSSPTVTEKSPTVRLAIPTTHDESTVAAIVYPTLTPIPGDPSASEPAAGHLNTVESRGAVERQLDASTTDAATDVELQSLTGTSTPQGDDGMDYSSVERDADRDAIALDNFRTRSTYQMDITDDRSSSSDDTGNDVTTNRADTDEEKLQTTDIDDDLNETTAPSVGGTSAKVSSIGFIEDLESPDVVTMVTTKTDDVVGDLASADFSSKYLTNDEVGRSSLIDQDPMTESIIPTSSSAEDIQPITTSGLSDELPDSSFVTQPPFEPVDAHSTESSTASVGFSANPSIISGRRSSSVLEASGAAPTQFPGSSDAGRLSTKIVLYSTYPPDGSTSHAAALLTSSTAAVAHEISCDLMYDDSPAASRRLPSATTSSLPPVVRKSGMTNDDTLILIVALTAVVCLVVIVAVIWLSRRRPKTQTAELRPNEITAELCGFKNAEKETHV